jgi:hypothetical protein
MKKTCLYCQIIYISYRKSNKFCSVVCRAKFFAKTIKKQKNGTFYLCHECGKQIYRNLSSIKNKKAILCSVVCQKIYIKRLLPNYGFKRISCKKPRRQYKQIRINNKNVLQHRWIMENFLKRPLNRWEHVHHINGNSTDKRLENLIVLSHSEHSRLTCAENDNYKRKII